MKKTLTLLLLFVSIVTYGQVKRIQLNLSGNHPFIPTVETGKVSLQTPVPASGYSSSTFTGSVKESFEGAAGLNFHGTFDYALSQKVFLTTGLGISYLHYKRSVSIGLPETNFQTESFADLQAGMPMGSIIIRELSNNRALDAAQPTVITSAKSGQTSVFYLQVPILGGTSFFNDKLFVRGGATVSWLMMSSVYKPRYTPDKGIEEVRISDSESFSSVLFSASVNVSYVIFKKFAIDASAQQYLTPIYKSTYRTAGNARYTVIGLGISYIITK